MSPVQARPVKELSRVNRKIFCKHYECCLDLAISRRWQSFSCARCTGFSPAQKPGTEWEEDALGCGALISVVFGRRIMPETDFWGY
jgi:hypothetical protein